jgi:hypothetical protein
MFDFCLRFEGIFSQITLVPTSKRRNIGTIECSLANELSEHVFNVLGLRKRGCDSVVFKLYA